MMTRTEILCWTAAMAAVAWPGTADAQFGGPPVGETYALSVELSREAAVLSRGAERVLCHCDAYDDVVDELRDVAEELQDLNRSLRRASYNPRRWNRVEDRAEDLEEEVCELAEEIDEAIRDLPGQRPRAATFYPGGPSHYRSRSVGNAPFVFSLQVGGREIRLAKPRDEAWPQRPPVGGHHFHGPRDRAAPAEAWALQQSVAQMRALAAEIVRLSRIR